MCVKYKKYLTEKWSSILKQLINYLKNLKLSVLSVFSVLIFKLKKESRFLKLS